MSRNEKTEPALAWKIAKAVLLYPVVVATGLVVFFVCNLVLMPAISLIQVARFVADRKFRREVLGKSPAFREDESGEIYYHPTHTWARMEAARVSIGLDEFTNSLIGKIIREIECCDVGTRLEIGETVWTLKCGDRSLEQIMPIAGTVIEVNTRLLRSPSRLATEPVEDLWIVKIRPSAPVQDLKTLFSLDHFRTWNEKVKDRIVKRFCTEAGLVAADGGTLVPDLASRLSPDQWTQLVNQEFK
jgi:glycine cleavage system H protein